MTAGPELIRNLVDLTTEVRGLRRDVNRSRWNIRVVAAIAVLGLAVSGILFAVRTEGQQRQLDRNTERLTQVVYTQCVIQDQTAARQIALIDSALTAERKKPRPDPKRIADLEKFKPSRVNCGGKP